MDRCLKTRLREYPSVSVSKGSETEREADFQAKALPERSPRLEGRRERRAECRFLDRKSRKQLFRDVRKPQMNGPFLLRSTVLLPEKVFWRKEAFQF